MQRDEESGGYQHQYYYYPQQQAGESATQAQAQTRASAPPYYGTFHGQYRHPHPGYPSPPSQFGHHTAVEGYPIIEPRPADRDLLPRPCCGLGVGWCLFILGWFLACVPWYVGAIMLVCTRPDPRERVGLVCCTIAAFLSVIAAIVGGTTATI